MVVNIVVYSGLIGTLILCGLIGLVLSDFKPPRRS